MRHFKRVNSNTVSTLCRVTDKTYSSERLSVCFGGKCVWMQLCAYVQLGLVGRSQWIHVHLDGPFCSFDGPVGGNNFEQWRWEKDDIQYGSHQLRSEHPTFGYRHMFLTRATLPDQVFSHGQLFSTFIGDAKEFGSSLHTALLCSAQLCTTN